MKKTIGGLIVLFWICISSILAVEAGITLGYQTKKTNDYMHAPYYVSIDLYQDIGDFRLYGKYSNEMRKSVSSFMFVPLQDYFTLGASYTMKQITFCIEHMCQHPVVTKEQYEGILGGYTKFEIRIGSD
jgi:S-adenosylmethionine synthetase